MKNGLGLVVGGIKGIAVLVVATILLLGARATASPPPTAIWYGSVNSSWGNPTNWTPSWNIPGSIQAVPGATTSVTIPAGDSIYPVITNNVAIGALSIIQGSGSCTVTNSTLTVGSGGITALSGSTFNVNTGGNIVSTGTVVIGGNFTVNGSVTGPVTVYNTATFTINSNATVNTVVGGFNANSGGGRVYIYGTLNDGTNALNDNTTISLAGGTFITGPIALLDVNLAVTAGNLTCGGITFDDGGTLTVTGASTVTSTTAWNFFGGYTTINSGNFNFSGGTQSIPSGSYTSLNLNGGGTITLSGGTVSSNLTVAANTVAGLTSGLNISVGTLTLGTAGQVNGTWGSTNSTAANKNSTYFAGSGILTVSNNAAAVPTTTTLAAVTAVTYGNNAIWTATVTPTPAGGSVQFQTNGVAIGTPVSLVAGKAAATNSLAAGTYAVTAAYSGTNTAAASTSASANQVVNPVTVTIASGLTAGNKTYDSTTAATINSNNVVLSGVLASDTAKVQLSTNGGSATFATATVANGLAITVSGLTLTGSAAANYTLTQPTGLTANITAATVTIAAGISTGNKVYNGTNTAIFRASNVVLNGVLASDTANVAFSATSYSAKFASASVTNNAAITVSGLTLTGSAAGNYTLTQPTGLTASITPAPITVASGIAANSKGYNGTTAATISSNSVVLSGVVAGDTASVQLATNGYSATFASAGVSNGVAVTVSGLTLTGSAAGNYTLTQPTGLTANITGATVTIASGLTAGSKIYNGTTAATINSNNVVLIGVVAADTANVSLSTNGYTAAFASASVTNGATVTVSGLALTGSAAGNYTLTQPTGLTASITPVTVTIASGITANNKVYNGTAAATISSNTVVLSGVVSADTANVHLATNGYTAAFGSASVTNGAAVTVSGLTLTGSAAANYTLTQPAGLTANITAASVTIASGITANNKIYDTTASATINSNNVVLAGVLAGDTANVHLVTNGYTATFASASVTNGVAVTVSGLTLTGSAAGNYTLTQPTGLAGNITANAVTIASGLTANNKIYNGTTTATISSNTVVLAGVLAGDTANVQLSTSGYTAIFASASVTNGVAVTVSGLTLTGSAAKNYALTQPTGLTANITAASVTIASGITANNKVYDATTNATISASSVVLSGVVSADTANVHLATNGYTAAFARASVTNGISVTVSDLTLTGSAAGNYTLTQPTGLTANITAASVTVASGITANNKAYDGTTPASLTVTNLVLNGVRAPDVGAVMLATNGYVANFTTANPANGIAVNVSGLTLTGSAAANYVLTQPTGLTANITRATLVISSPANNAVIITNSPTVTLTGTTAGNALLTGVWASLDGTTWAAATSGNNFLNWSVTLPVTAGLQTAKVYAQDGAGNNYATNTVNFTISHTSPLSLTINGNGIVTPTLNGQALTIGQNYSLTAAGQNGWAFTNWTSNLLPTSGSAALNFTMSSNLTLTANFVNVTRPTLQVTSPTAGQQIISNATAIVVSGLAAANPAGGVSIATVRLSLDGINWTNATLAGTGTSWSAVLPVTPGTQVLQAYAVDSTGLASLTNTVSFKLIHTSVLTVATTGTGSVTPNLNGQVLNVGQNYSLAAAPAANWRFTNWTSNVLPTTNSANLNFTMASNLTLTANFAYAVNPVLTVTALTNNQVVVTNDTFTTVKGVTVSKVAINGVWVTIGTNGWMLADTTNGWATWSTVQPIATGPQTMRAYALDIYGNNSGTNVINFTIARTAYMTVVTNGNGTIYHNWDNQNLQVGGVFTMTATGRNGWSFLNWTSNQILPGQTLGTNATLTFTMTTNLVITGNFVDLSQPTVTLPILPAGVHTETNQAPFVINGGTLAAADGSLVTNVWVSFNNGAWSNAITANNWTNWTLAVNPVRGATNTIQAYAADAVGNISATNSTYFYYVQILPVTVLTNQFGTGLGSISLTTNGQPLMVGSSYYIKAQPAAGCVFSNWTSNLLPPTNASTFLFTYASNLVLYANFLDITRPTLAVTGVTDGQVVSNATYNIPGTAADNCAVARVLYSINSNAWQNASGTTNWSFAAALNPGLNTLQVYSVDPAGNGSLTNTFRLTYKVPASLTLRTNGLGTITGQSSSYSVGQTYTFTAVPAAGFVFTNWTGPQGLVSKSAALQVAMTTNLQLTANFVDTQAPTVTITTPATTRVLSSTFALAGTATDNWSLTGVYCQINGGAWLPASTVNGYTNWNIMLNLSAGTNVINVAATGLGSPTPRYSATKSVTIVFLAAPFNLQNLRAEVTPDDGTPGFELNFGASTFNEYAWNTNLYNAAGSFGYTNPAPDQGVLTLQATALPQNVYQQTLQLAFTNRLVARFNYTNDLGQTVGATAVFTVVTNITPNALAGKTLRFVNSQGQVGAWVFQYNKVTYTLGNQSQTYNWSGQAYGTCAALLTLTSASQTNWCLFHFETGESAEYYIARSDGSEDYGIAGFDDTLTGLSVAPGNLAGRELLSNSGSTLTAVQFAAGQFTLITSDDSLTGAGTYGFRQTVVNQAQLSLNYTVPQAATTTTVVRFYNPSFGISTNPVVEGVLIH